MFCPQPVLSRDFPLAELKPETAFVYISGFLSLQCVLLMCNRASPRVL